VLDALLGEERSGGETRPSGLPRSDVLSLQAADGSRLTVRPSGTEPKIKFYLELVGRAAAPAEVSPARAALDAAAQGVRASLIQDLRLA
jgi:phosphoglucomutase